MGLNEHTDPATSTAPRDVVRRQYLASAAGDLAALRATLAPDVEWTEMAGFPLAGTYRTPQGLTSNVMEVLGRDWDGWAAHDDKYVVEGEDVVVLARYTATNRATGKTLNVRVTHHFIVRADSSCASSSSSTRPRSRRRRRRARTLSPSARPARHPRRPSSRRRE